MNIKIEEQLSKDGYVLELPVGTSMQPMLEHRQDQLLIEKISRKPVVNDVVLHKRDSGQYVLHRIVKARKDFYIIRGDNRYCSEKVYPQQIIGILKGFYKGDEYIDCENNKRYKRYVLFRRLSYPFRYVVNAVIRYGKIIISKIRR